MKTNYEILMRLYTSIHRGFHVIFISHQFPNLQAILDDRFGESVFVARVFRHDLTIVYYCDQMRGRMIRFTDLDCVVFTPVISEAQLQKNKGTINLFHKCFYQLSTEETRLAVYYCLK